MNTPNRQGKRASPDDHETEWSGQSGGQSSPLIVDRTSKRRRVRESASPSEEAPAAFLPPAWLERTWDYTKNLFGLASPGEQNFGLLIQTLYRLLMVFGCLTASRIPFFVCQLEPQRTHREHRSPLHSLQICQICHSYPTRGSRGACCTDRGCQRSRQQSRGSQMCSTPPRRKRVR